ncbi:MAG: hypothetical protein JXR51_04800 [Bacteroidales bacterium]|nr:hypothetical protein [Bacteroidales bacterium]MBN2756477.1 hypothetical protein [Bacteroidales bacterium]
MKSLLTILFLSISLNIFSQSEIMDSIAKIRKNNTPELAENFCTEGFWNAVTDGGIIAFKRICKMPDIAQFKLNDEQTKGNRSVLTVYYLVNSEPRDLVYIYMVKESDKWLMDGFNETKSLINYFFDGYYSGHFSPEDLPEDPDLADFGTKLALYSRDEENLIKLLDEKMEPGSTLDFFKQLSDTNFENFTYDICGYDEKFNRGYIHYKGKSKTEDDYYARATIYILIAESGKIKILDQDYSIPSTDSFIYSFTLE